MPKERIDRLLVDRGLAESRTRAQAMILAGQVLAGNQRIDKPGQLVDTSLELRIKNGPSGYVSRGGLKLERALEDFKIDPTGKLCVDIGASTGGFTDCMLSRGARKVWAVDVGHNQLDWRIRQDPRVVVMEGVNARYLNPANFPVKFDLGAIDVSFISITMVLPAVVRLMDPGADIVILIKPQFEVGKGAVGKGGIVKSALQHQEVLSKIADFVPTVGQHIAGLIPSPILGAEGNREFLAHLRSEAQSP